MTTMDGLREILRETLQLGKRADRLDESTVLFGGIPEFDSVAVVTVVTSIEDRFGIVIEDDEITAGTFETMGSLRAFVDSKLAA
jgi:acyl carrier protein